MLHEFEPFSANLGGFILLNWVATLGCSAFLLYVYFCQRFLLTKPSMIMLCYVHVLFQWPLSVYSGAYEQWLPQPFAMVALIHGFVVLGLLGSTLAFRKAARTVWERIPSLSSNGGYNLRLAAIAALFIACLVLVGCYFFYVPISCTGLYALLTRPDTAPLAREISHKLLADTLPRYSLTLLYASFAPFLIALITSDLLSGARFTFDRVVRSVVLVLAACLAGAFAFLSGAKGILVGLSLVVVFTICWQRRLAVPIWAGPLFLIAALLPSYIVFMLLSLSPMRSEANDFEKCLDQVNIVKTHDKISLATSFAPTGPVVGLALQTKNEALEEAGLQLLAITDDANVFYSLFLRIKVAILVAKINLLSLINVDQIVSVLKRAFVIPLEVGGWYVHHLQTKGALGIGGVPRLANILNVEPIDGPNLIGRIYGPIYFGHPVPDTISAGAGFIFGNFAYFGYWAIPLNLLLLWLTDIALWVYRHVLSILIVPLLGVASLSTLKFLESDYSVTWLTHGFGVVLIISLCLTSLLKLGSKFMPNG